MLCAARLAMGFTTAFAGAARALSTASPHAALAHGQPQRALAARLVSPSAGAAAWARWGAAGARGMTVAAHSYTYEAVDGPVGPAAAAGDADDVVEVDYDPAFANMGARAVLVVWCGVVRCAAPGLSAGWWCHRMGRRR